MNASQQSARRHNRSTFFRTVALLGDYPLRTVVAVLPGLAMAALNVAIPIVISRAVDQAVQRDAPQAVLHNAMIVALLAAARWALAAWRRDACGRLGADLEFALRRRMWQQLLGSNAGDVRNPPPGDLLSRLTNDARTVRTFLTWALVFTVINAALFVLATAQMLLLSPKLAVFVGAMAPVLVLGTVLYNRRLLELSRDLQGRTGQLSARTENLAAGIQTVKALGRERLESEGFARAAHRLRDAGLATAYARANFEPLLGVLPHLSLALVLWQGGEMAASGQISIGTLLVFISYLLMLAWPIKALAMLIGYSTGALAAAERVFEVLDRPPAVADPATAQVLPAGPGAARLSLRNVTVTDLDGRAVLAAANLTLAAGSRTAVIGANGSGKTSLARLLGRFEDPDSGVVLLDGHDLRALTVSSVRRGVIVLGSDPVIFPATADENLRAGLDREIDAAELRRVLETAEALDMVDTWPHGLNSQLGEGGLNLSGGERQRLALARALLHQPRLLVLDEGLNHLDPITEERVLARVAEQLPGTLLLISSNPVALNDLDGVYRLDEGVLQRVEASWAPAEMPVAADLSAS